MFYVCCRRYGSDRSSVYVALSCLVQQLKTESRADVFATIRKLRSQRQGMIQHVVRSVIQLTISHFFKLRGEKSLWALVPSRSTIKS